MNVQNISSLPPYLSQFVNTNHEQLNDIYMKSREQVGPGILSFKSMEVLPDKNSLYYFVGIDNCRFKNPVLPGDTLILEVEINRVRGGVWKYSASASVEENICAEATILCALRKV